MKKMITLCIALSLFFSVFSSVSAASSYLYYYGQGCPHCANVDAYMKGTDGYNRVDIEKKEVYYNKENSAAMMEDAKALGLEEKQVGVPFLIIDNDGEKSFLVGDGPIIDHFKPILGEPKTNPAKYVVLAILGVLAIVVPLGIILGGKKS